jgi:hypothetical protein
MGIRCGFWLALWTAAWTDFIHLTETGGRLMGARFAAALLRDFKRYLGKHPTAGCASQPAAGP